MQTWIDPDTGYEYEIAPDDSKSASAEMTTWVDPETGYEYEIAPIAPEAPKVVEAPQAGMTNISRGDPLENQRTINEVETQKKLTMIRSLASNKAVDPMSARKMVEEKFGNGEGVDWYVSALRKGYKGPINLYTPEAPGLTVEGQPEEKTTAETVLGPLADIARGAKEGFERTGPNIIRTGARGLAEIGLLDPSVVEDLDEIDQLGKADYGDLYVDPNGLGRDVGNFAGAFAAEMPLNELKPFTGSGKVGELLDTALQGAVGNILYEGGEDPLQNAAVGAVGGAALHGVLGSALAPLSKEGFGNQARRFVDTSHTGKIKEQIDYVTEGWADTPEFRVEEKNKNLSTAQRKQMIDDGIPNIKDVRAYVAKDGRVHVLAQNIKNPSEIPAIVYHEVLGHSGMAKAFRDDLSRLLDDVYETNWAVRKQADDYIANNKSVYRGADQRDRATEEALAEMSENGRIDLNTWESVKNTVRNYGRELGLDLRYTDNDVKAILKRSHDAVIDGTGEVGAVTGNRYIKGYHGSPQKDITQFDNRKAGSGSGKSQGHGVYLTSEEKAAARHRGPDGSTYEVSVDRPDEHFLDWQKSVSEQSPYIQDVLERVGYDKSGKYEDTGADIYRRLQRELGSDAEVSRYLNEEGIAGNTYMGEAHATGSPVKNYVVFDDKAASITNKYSLRKDGRTKSEGVRKFEQSVKEEMPDRTMTEEEALDRVENFYGPPSKVMRKKMEVDPTLAVKAVQVTEEAIEKSLVIGKKIVTGEASGKELAEYAYQIARAAEWAAKVQGFKSDIGRALRMLQLVTEKGESMKALEGVDIGNLGNENYLYTLAKMIDDAEGDQKLIGKIVADAAKPLPLDYVTSFRYAMMLLSPATHAKNFLGNVSMVALDIGSHATASVIGQVRRGAERVHMREVAAQMYGLIRALGEGSTWKDVASSWRAGHPAHMVSKIEDSRVLLPAGLSAPQKTLAATDSLFRSMITNSYFYSQAMRQALEEGLSGAKLADRVDELIANPNPKALEWADRQASVLQLVDKATPFTEGFLKAKNIAVETAGRGKNKARPGPAAQITKFALENTVPFLRVRDRLFMAGVRHSPLSFLDRVTREDFLAGGARRDLAIGRTVFGSALVGLLIDKAMNGEATGLLPEGIINYNKREAKQAEGEQENSLLINGKWVSLDGFDVVSSINPVVVKITNKYKKGELSDENFAVEALKLVGTMSGELLKASAMQGVGDFYKGILDTEGVSGTNVVAGVASSFVVPAAMRKYNEKYDPTQRDTVGDGSTEDRVYGRIASGVPGLSDKLPAKVDIYGKPVKKEGRNVSGIGQTKTPTKDKTILEMKRLTETNNENPVVGQVDLKRYGVTDREVLSQYRQLSGFWVKKALDELVESEEYKEMTDPERVKAVRKTTSSMRKEAREYMEIVK